MDKGWQLCVCSTTLEVPEVLGYIKDRRPDVSGGSKGDFLTGLSSVTILFCYVHSYISFASAIPSILEERTGNKTEVWEA